MKRIAIIGTILILLLLTAGCVGSNTPYQQISIGMNETKIVPYEVSNVDLIKEYFGGYNVFDHASISGYMILSIPDIGNYDIKLTSNDPSDKVAIEWEETYEQREYIGDKFSGEYENVTMEYWRGGRIQHCTTDRYSDCSMKMELMARGNSPEIQIYIVGHGSGTIEITRTG